jgi:hypothetical protein
MGTESCRYVGDIVPVRGDCECKDPEAEACLEVLKKNEEARVATCSGKVESSI